MVIESTVDVRCLQGCLCGLFLQVLPQGFILIAECAI